MKKNISSLLLSMALLITTGCRAQLVKTFSDVPKLKTEERTFVGYPLAKFLAEIKLPITRVTAIATNNSEYNPGFFRFQFQDVKTIDSLKLRSKLPLGIVVYVKEVFDWDYLGRPTDQKNTWTPEDAKKYANLTVTHIRLLQNP